MLADISLPTDVRDVVSETIATYGRLDILLNNGNGFTSRDAALSLLRENDWDRIVDLNLKGAFLCCQHTVPFLSRSGQGSIIHLPPAWWMTQPASPRLAEAVSRGGLLAMTRELADELASRNVRSNLIWPCILGAGQPPKTMHHQSLLASRVFQLSPQGPSKTRSIARIALYLASNDARNLNGAAIIVNLAR
jgi:3-oxoacyl-[acyl-carrier protein] reductase